MREVCAHAVLGKHENVVQYFSAWSEEDRMLVSLDFLYPYARLCPDTPFTSFQHHIIIKFQIQFEYCNGRSLADDLTDRVKRKRGGMNTDEIVLLLQHCGRGLSYIHSQQLGIGSFRALLSQ